MIKRVITVTYEPTGQRGSPEVEGYHIVVCKPEVDMQIADWAELMHATMVAIARSESITDGETGRTMTHKQVLRQIKGATDAAYYAHRKDP